jgi:hypothetical protein
MPELRAGFFAVLRMTDLYISFDWARRAAPLSSCPAHLPFRRRQYPNFTRLLPECSPVIDSKPGFGLPLVYHLVQHRMLDLGPRMPRDVAAADGDIEWQAGPDLDRQLTQPGAHARREADRNLAQAPAEVLRVQALVQGCEPVQEDQIAGASPLTHARSRRGWRMRLHRKRQELPLRRPAEHTRNTAVQKTHDRLEHPVRSKGVASMNTEDTPVEAEHHRTVGVGNDSLYLPEAEHGQAISEQMYVLSATLLTCCPAVPLSRLHSP